MSFNKPTIVLAISIALGINFLAYPSHHAHARPLFEKFFPKKTKPIKKAQPRKKKQIQNQRKKKIKRIRSPRYYQYRPNAMTLISLSALAKTIETAKASNEQTSGLLVNTDATNDLMINGLSNDFARARQYLADFKLRTYPEIAHAIINHYKAYPAFMWVRNGTINGKARHAIRILEGAGAYGLSANDYEIGRPDDIATSFSRDSNLPEQTLLSFEMELSARILLYILDAQRGRIHANKLSGYHDLPRHKVKLEEALLYLSEHYDIRTYLESQHPQNRYFKALQNELKDLRSVEEMPITIARGSFIRPGNSHAELSNVLDAIQLRGSSQLLEKYSQILTDYDGDIFYAQKLVPLVRAFQRENHLKADGIIGRNTIQKLIGNGQQKINMVTMAMERLRWLPHDLGGRYVFINQPAYRVRYMKQGQEVISMRVVIGKKANQTNFFYDQLERIEYNPYWGVPRSIIVNEMVPKLYRDPYYLDHKGYEVTTASGRRVSSASVNWSAVANNRMAINVRQPPGRRNALGELKILFPNKHAIYMHDTPAKSLFKRNRRAFSHGCVRLHDARAMAAALLDKNKTYVDRRIAKRKNKAEPIPGKIPVYVAYFTAWPAQDGTVQYFDDVYGRDNHLNQAFAAIDKVRQVEEYTSSHD